MNMLLLKNNQLQMRLKRFEDEVRSEKSVVDAKHVEMESLR